MFTQQLFELALNIQEPWYIKDIQLIAKQFDCEFALIIDVSARLTSYPRLENDLLRNSWAKWK